MSNEKKVLPLISIIVPVHNAENTLERCVTSLINQSYLNIEIILVENGSQDSSWELCNKFKDKRVILVRQLEAGVSKARNRGLDIAKGKYITFCDDDDFYTYDHIEQSFKLALKDKSDLVISGYFFERNNKFIPKLMNNSNSFNSNSELLVNIITVDEVMGVCWNKFFKKSVIKKNRFPEDLDILEDTYFLLEVLKNINTISYVKKPLYYYCYNSNSSVRNISSLISNNHFKYITAYKRLLKDFYFDKRIEILIHAKIFEFAIEAKYMIKKYKLNSKKLIFNIKKELINNRYAFYICKDFSTKRKIKDLMKLHVPILRDIKHFTRE